MTENDSSSSKVVTKKGHFGIPLTNCAAHSWSQSGSHRPTAAAAEHLARRRGAGDAVHKGAEAALGTARQLQHTHAAPPLDDGFHQRPWHVGGRALEEVRVGWRRTQRRQRGHGCVSWGQRHALQREGCAWPPTPRRQRRRHRLRRWWRHRAALSASTALPPACRKRAAARRRWHRQQAELAAQRRRARRGGRAAPTALPAG